jgi:hypothetical protein
MISKPSAESIIGCLLEQLENINDAYDGVHETSECTAENLCQICLDMNSAYEWLGEPTRRGKLTPRENLVK